MQIRTQRQKRIFFIVLKQFLSKSVIHIVVYPTEGVSLGGRNRPFDGRPHVDESEEENTIKLCINVVK